MDVNEHERLPVSNIALGHKVKEWHFYCCSTFHSHGSVFHNEHNSYPLMNAKCFSCIYDIERRFDMLFSCTSSVLQVMLISLMK